nr:hypothetical protein [Tanacetum cinerariifolium]
MKDQQRSFANVRRKALEFQAGDRVMLKISPRKGIIQFGKRWKLNPRVKTASTPIETQKPLVKVEEAADVVVHLYRFQVTPKTSHLQAVKRIFRYLKDQPKLGVWYPKVSSFDLEDYLDSDYDGANLDRKSTTGGFQFLDRRLISWQRKKPTIVATSTTEAEYVAVAHCCGQSDLKSSCWDRRLYVLVFTLHHIWLSIHHIWSKRLFVKTSEIRSWLTICLKLYGFQLTMLHSKELASPKQTALGVNTPRCDEDSLEIMELMVFFVQFVLRKMELELLLVKIVNDEVRVQTLIDGKKVTIKESSIRRTLRIDDDEGTSCLANDDIFTGLANMGYEKMSEKLTFYKAFFSPQWNTMASAIICLATNQEFNFSRYILQSLVKNLKAGVPFYMFPRVGTGFYGVITPLFESMLVQGAKDVGKAQDDVSIPTEPSTSKPHKKHKSKKQQAKSPKVPSLTPSPEHQLPSPLIDPIPTTKDSLTLQELMDLCTRLSNKVMDLESEVIDIKSSFTDRIQKIEDIFDQLEEENRALKEKSFKTTEVDTVAKAYNLDLQHAKKSLACRILMRKSLLKWKRRRRGVIIQEPDETTSSVIVHSEVQSKDKGKGILIEEPKPLKGQAQIDLDEAFTRQLEAELNANINWNDVIEQVKRREKKDNLVMRFQRLKRKLMTEAHARKNMMIYLKNMAGFKMYFFKEATPLASKVPVVDYLIHHENNKPYYKIIRADGTHKLFLRFITLLKNFDRDDLETLWKIVKKRFEYTKPKNFSDDFLLNTFKIMFEKPNVEANVWRDQKGIYGLAKVKNWKLFESCGVHVLTLTTT